LNAHPALLLGFIIDARFTIRQLTTFLAGNVNRNKVLMFRNNPISPTVALIQAAIAASPVEFIVFDETKTNSTTRGAFAAHRRRILLTDGFKKQDANVDYPRVSAFTSNYGIYRADGWHGVGDYLTIGDNFQPGGGPVYVVALHVTKLTPHGLVVHHFTSTSSRTVRGLAAVKFSEANTALVTSRETAPMASVGIEYFRDWHHRSHNPQLVAAKKASIIHHMETMSALV
jgi:hypothetical protein